MRFPISTGEGARLLHTTEPRLAETVRRGQVVPEPRVVAGRRLWEKRQLMQAAVTLGVLTSELNELLTDDAEQSNV